MFETNALYCVQYNAFVETISEGLYDVHLEGKVVEATKTTAGAFKWKRGILMSDFSHSFFTSFLLVFHFAYLLLF